MTNKEFQIHNLWPVPIYQSNIPVREKWKEYVKSLNYKRTHIKNSDISDDRYILNSMPELKSEIELHCENYVRKYLSISKNVEFYLLNSWSNVHKPKDGSQIHYHGNSLLSGVYYPILPKNSGNINFHMGSHINNIFPKAILVEYDEYNNLNASRYELALEEGSIVLFPSHLEHSVEKNNSLDDRYSIAFNFFIRGSLGKEEYALKLDLN